MTVKELIEQLQQIDDKERIVILQSGSEGNDYSPLAGIDPDLYTPINGVHGETGEACDTPCLVLYPRK